MRRNATSPVAKMFLALVSAAATVSVGLSAASRQETLRSVVVVSSALPQGCALAADSSLSRNAREGRTAITARAIPTNPWSGSDIGVVANILQLIDPPLAVPDGPPPSARAVKSLWLARAREVTEAAAATYDSGSGLISVYALRYRSADVEFGKPQKGRLELKMGSLRVVVSGDGSACSDAVVSHAKSALFSSSGRPAPGR